MSNTKQDLYRIHLGRYGCQALSVHGRVISGGQFQ